MRYSDQHYGACPRVQKPDEAQRAQRQQGVVHPPNDAPIAPPPHQRSASDRTHRQPRREERESERGLCQRRGKLRQVAEADHEQDHEQQVEHADRPRQPARQDRQAWPWGSLVASDQPADRPDHQRRQEQHDTAREQAVMQSRVFIPGQLAIAVDWEVALKQVRDLALVICSEHDGLLAAHLVEHQRRHLYPLRWLLAQPGDRQIPFIARAHLGGHGQPEQPSDFLDRRHSRAGRLIAAGELDSALGEICGRRWCDGHRRRVVAVEKCLQKLRLGGTAARAGIRHEQTQVVLGQQREQAAEGFVVGRARVNEQPLAVQRHLPKTVGHAIHVWVIGEVLAMHVLHRRRLQDAGVAQLSVLEMRDPELRDVGGGRTQPAGRRDLKILERFGVVRLVVRVADGQLRG